MIILKITKKTQGFTLSFFIEDTFFNKPWVEEGVVKLTPTCFRVKLSLFTLCLEQ